MINTINQPEFNDQLQRRLNLTTPGPSSTLAPEIMPVYDVSAPPVDTLWLQGVRLCGAIAQVAAVAGQQSTFRLRNPAGSGMVVQVERLQVRASTAMEIQAGLVIVNANMATAANGSPRDSRGRIAAANATQAIPSAETSAAPLLIISGSPALIHNNGTLSSTYDVPFVITPGFAFDVVGMTVNIAMNVNVFWRERAAARSELG